MSFEEAAAVPLGGLEAWSYLKRADLQAGQKVLINGAGGCIGTMAVQLARHFGAEVTAVDSGEKLEMLRSIGAGEVIDYTREDFTKRGERYDVIFDVIGTSSPSGSEGSLKENGRYFSANPGAWEQMRGLWNLMAHREEVVSEYRSRRHEDLDFLRELMEAGEIRAVIDRRYPLGQMAVWINQ